MVVFYHVFGELVWVCKWSVVSATNDSASENLALMVFAQARDATLANVPSILNTNHTVYSLKTIISGEHHTL